VAPSDIGRRRGRVGQVVRKRVGGSDRYREKN